MGYAGATGGGRGHAELSASARNPLSIGLHWGRWHHRPHSTRWVRFGMGTTAVDLSLKKNTLTLFNRILPPPPGPHTHTHTHMTLLAHAARPLLNAHVTGFVSVNAAIGIYTGSLLWFLALVGLDVYSLVGTSSNDTLYSMLIAGNSVMFILQTANVLYGHFRFWPLVSLYYTLQLWALGLRAVVLSTKLGAPWPHALMLLAQGLFTASQLSVTLEYLYRRSEACSAHKTPARFGKNTTVVVRRRTQNMAV